MTQATASTRMRASGDAVIRGILSYEWDNHSRLKKVTWGAGKTTEFKYNALGQRCESTDTVAGVATRHFYLFDGIRLIDRRTGTNVDTATIDRRYFSEGEQRKNGSTGENHFYSRDHLGSIREVVKSVEGANTLVARYDYDPYGKRLTQYQSSANSGGCDFGYTGRVTTPSPVSDPIQIPRQYQHRLLRFRSITFDGATSNGGNDWIDNVHVNAVSETRSTRCPRPTQHLRPPSLIPHRVRSAGLAERRRRSTRP